MSAPRLVAHFFRHEYGRQVATLTRRVGAERLEAIEGAVQFALMRALEIWPSGGVPQQPSAWLHRAAQLYALLGRVAPSPLHELNRAVALAEWQGPSAGLAALEDFVPPPWLEASYLWAAVLADLHRRCGHRETEARSRELALDAAPSAAVRALLQRRLGDAEPI